ncbi:MULTISPECIES: hypothetical protein [Pseudomonas]|uniref:Membrane protein n=2 Tax=Pseudomonas fluorescens TaxID=294 RepID=C3KBC2_PSEFS|nr:MULTISPECIES: hypothetical protein [Pseudomonas]KJZ53020.1 hypothetical protein VC37_17725 [Pseudomonas marginalis]KJZ54250.1 hypothetical protein VC36_25395 [Pseudomonas marginalis]MBZ6454146.1 hypothetical protein [Pseudomonas fluorescens group sp.]MBZ6460132.1 hypothetical protein [Pseudomonas fluorescens group sp.]MBZ6467023.1 hypothetical protein [Pseudomonas fluorescens group sp.]
MSLKEDWDEMLSHMKTGNSLFKVYSVIPIIAMVNSLASLSDGIVKWRGIFRDTLSVYQLWIRDPVTELFSLADIHLTKSSMDFLLSMLIILACWFRSMIAGTDWTNKAEAAGTRAAIAFTACVLLIAPFYLNNSQQTLSTTEMLFMAAFWAFAPLIGSNRKFFKHYFILLGTSATCIVVLAMINIGLTKPL